MHAIERYAYGSIAILVAHYILFEPTWNVACQSK